MTALTRYWKTIIAVLGLASVLLADPVVESIFGDEPQPWLKTVLAVVTALLVYFKANTPPAGQPSDPTVSETG